MDSNSLSGFKLIGDLRDQCSMGIAVKISAATTAIYFYAAFHNNFTEKDERHKWLQKKTFEYQNVFFDNHYKRSRGESHPPCCCVF